MKVELKDRIDKVIGTQSDENIAYKKAKNEIRAYQAEFGLDGWEFGQAIGYILDKLKI